MTAKKMEELVSLCKRRGFIYQTNELYGGMQGVYDYGPLGVELKNNLKQAWWSSMVYERDDVEGLDSSILTHPNVLKYSGHEDTFTDPLVDCKDCKSRWRADHIDEGKCPSCGSEFDTDLLLRSRKGRGLSSKAIVVDNDLSEDISDIDDIENETDDEVVSDDDPLVDINKEDQKNIPEDDVVINEDINFIEDDEISEDNSIDVEVIDEDKE